MKKPAEPISRSICGRPDVSKECCLSRETYLCRDSELRENIQKYVDESCMQEYRCDKPRENDSR